MTSPRWKKAIESAISQYKNQTVIQIATIDSTRPEGPIPRVRSHIFRAFLDSPVNPALPLLLSSTDIRTPKVKQLTAKPQAEVVWWIEGTKQQFRIIANIHIVPTPAHPLHSNFKQNLCNAEPGSALSLFKNDDWEAKRIDMFKSMSANMKATWCRPLPGSRLEGGQEEAKRWPARVEEPKLGLPREEYDEAKRNWDTALGNFALVIIDPVEIDFVDLSSPPDRRTLFTKKKGVNENDVWAEEELVP
ncbi:hypothetical protein M413DRAFT_439096 [Hebeloma cylindrosporum]|uniref:Pyridoxamine 5'-phosphate oxidase Alr4036 family FMN-binding domain-containing protein n=1 Tax=Hebeloma cylindrosporum TaxID=76867 RepID=A0A0C2Z2F0_HEBCY|nr:hypothetical protein M413DRAFT_439096 [Hebeloma cylindrosporum h7]